MTLLRWLLVGLATLRLTRFVTQDWLGEWWLVRPAKLWALKAERAERLRTAARKDPYTYTNSGPFPPIEHMALGDEPLTWQGKLVKGLDCPFCVGFWLGAAVLLGEATVGRLPGVRRVWRFGLGALALNYVVGHVSRKLDS